MHFCHLWGSSLIPLPKKSWTRETINSLKAVSNVAVRTATLEINFFLSLISITNFGKKINILELGPWRTVEVANILIAAPIV